MNEQYATWIGKIPEQDMLGRCKEACTAMLEEFPELILVRGHYDCPIWGKREHWWCKTVTGEVVDPTAKQFPSRGLAGEYIKWIEGAEEPTGKCPQCGEYCRAGYIFCSTACSKNYMAYLKGELLNT